VVYTLLGRKEYWTPLSMLISEKDCVACGTGSLNSRRVSDTHDPVLRKPPETTTPSLMDASWKMQRVVPVMENRHMLGPTLATVMSMSHCRERMT
jgi:hypothetical protein